MIIGTAFTLFVVPSIYVLVARTHTAEQVMGEGEAVPASGRLRLREACARGAA